MASNTLIFTLLGNDRVSHTLRQVGDNAERSARQIEASNARSGRSFSAMLPALGTAALATGKWLGIVGAAIPAAANLTALLVNIAPAAGLAATGILMAGSAMAALKIGMSGVGPAVKAALDPTNPKAFAKAMEKLSPNARAFVKELRAIAPAIKTAVQDKLFAGLDKQLKAAAKTTVPALKKSFLDSAGALNLMGRGVLTTAANLGKSGALGQALDGANAGLVNLSGLPATVVQGLVQIGAAAAPSFKRLTSAGGDALDRLSVKMTDAFKSGGMQKAIDGAITLIGQLVTVGANVGRILGGVFGAAQASGGGMLGVLKDVTDQFAKLVNTKGVQDGLKALFSVMSQLGKTVAPLLGEALKQIAPVLSALGPPVQVLIGALGDALQPIIKALGPVLVDAATAIGQLVVSAAPLLPVIGQLVASLLPTLSPILNTLASVFLQLAPVIKQVADQIGPILTPIISGLGTILSQFVTQYATLFLQVLQQLIPVIPQLVPVALQFADSLGQILTQLAPLLPQIMLLSTQFITQLLPAILPLVPPLMKLASLWIRLATDVIIGIVIPSMKKIVSFMQGMRDKLQPAIDAAKNITKGIAHAFEWLYDHLIGHSVIPDTVNGIVRWFAGLPGKAVAALGNIGSRLGSVMSRAGSSMLTAAQHGVSDAVSAIRGLPGRARSALGNISGALASAGRSLISGFISGITSKIPSVKSLLNNLTSMIPSWKGPKTKDAALLTPAGKLLIEGLIAGIDVSISSLKSKLGQVTNLIARAIDINKGNRHKVQGLNALSDLVAKDNKKLLSLAAQRDAIAAKIKEAKAFAATVTSTAKGTATLSSLGTDALTGHGAGIKAGLQEKLAQIRQFSKYISILAKRHLNKTMLREILEMGPEQGFAYASELAGSSAKTISEINGVQSAINKESKKLGNKGADLLYDSGKNAGKGFLAGLQGQQKAIEQLMINIAKGMQKAIRKALGIKSPSTVMAQLGGYTTEGLAVGITGRMPVLASALATVSDAVAGADVSLGQPVMGRPAGGGGGGVTHVQITINGALDPVAVGKQLQKILLELKRTSGGNFKLGVA